MTRLTVKLSATSLLLFSAYLPVGYAQKSTASPQAQTTRPTADPIVGAWKLDIDKSTNPAAEAEILTIAPQGDEFKLTFIATHSNGYNPHYEVVTDMKRTISKPTDSGRPMNDAWRFTRSEPNVFVKESMGPFGGAKEEYTVSSDGKTLTVHELPGNSNVIAGKVDSKRVIHPVRHVLVFEKIPGSEGQRLTQEMVDSDAAQKALGAEKAAAQAVLDAAACSRAPGQTAEPESIANESAWHEYICPKDGFAISLPNAPKKQSLQRSNFYKLFQAEDESIVAQLWVSAEPVDCTGWLREMRAMVNQPLPNGAIRGTTETTFRGRPAFESADAHTNGPTYQLYDLNECLGNTTYRFHARWLTDHHKPEEVTRIFDSFRLLTKENTQ
ncbi:MAG TPA: hypothetical protein VIW23_14690 [Candidatus Acidoferrum sp.]|jgi:hypothetical protein